MFDRDSRQTVQELRRQIVEIEAVKTIADVRQLLVLVSRLASLGDRGPLEELFAVVPDRFDLEQIIRNYCGELRWRIRQALKLVLARWKKISTSTSAQLRPQDPGLLSCGGPYIDRFADKLWHAHSIVDLVAHALRAGFWLRPETYEAVTKLKDVAEAAELDAVDDLNEASFSVQGSG
jgi:hypothetical protein